MYCAEADIGIFNMFGRTGAPQTGAPQEDRQFSSTQGLRRHFVPALQLLLLKVLTASVKFYFTEKSTVFFFCLVKV